MKEFIDKLISRLKEKHIAYLGMDNSIPYGTEMVRLFDAISIVNQLAEEYNNESVKGDLISRSALLRQFAETTPFGCGTVGIKFVDELIKNQPTYYNDGWIPVSERLPEDCDNRFYMCIVENHEEDLPMFCQYDENYGFGFWQDIYDEHTLGFVDSEFKTNEELGYEKVIAWQNVPSYQPKGE